MPPPRRPTLNPRSLPAAPSDDIKDVQARPSGVEAEPAAPGPAELPRQPGFYTTRPSPKPQPRTTQGARAARGARDVKENFAATKTSARRRTSGAEKGKPQAGRRGPRQRVGDRSLLGRTDATARSTPSSRLARQLSLGAPDEDASRLRKASTLARKASRGCERELLAVSC